MTSRDPRFPPGAAILGIPVLILAGWMTINLAETLVWRLALMWVE